MEFSQTNSKTNNSVNDIEDFYKFLNINYETSLKEINKICNEKIKYYKSMPKLNEKDANDYKNYKKAYYLFNNPEYRKIYDEHIKKINNDLNSRKKNSLNQSFGFNRIFSLENKGSFNLEHNLSLRPKNVGLAFDDKPEFDKPLNVDNSFLPIDEFSDYGEV
jgi:DnaJ-class molecular chaperone